MVELQAGVASFRMKPFRKVDWLHESPPYHYFQGFASVGSCLYGRANEGGDLQERSGWRPSGAESRPERISDDRPLDGVFGHRDKRLMNAARASGCTIRVTAVFAVLASVQKQRPAGERTDRRPSDSMPHTVQPPSTTARARMLTSYNG